MPIILGICVLVAAAGLLFGRLVLPSRVRTWLQRLWDEWWVQRRARRRGDDPFATLTVQVRLGQLGRELDALNADTGRNFARVHHLRAAQSAYDALLDEACRLAGVEEIEGDGALHRLFAESALRERGWTW
jgi:hypothetical protein